MEPFTRNRILELPPNGVQEIRRIYDLDKTERIEEAVDILESWIQKQDHFLKKDFSRVYLEKIIVNRKGSVEKAKKQMDKMCTMRTLLPHFFSKYNVNTEFDGLMDAVSVVLLPKTTTDFYRVWLAKLKGGKLSEKTVLQYYQYSIILFEYILAHDYHCGVIAVMDLNEFNIMDLISVLSPAMLQQFITLSIEAYGARIKGIYILSQSKIIDLLVNIVGPMLSQKIFSRMRVFKTSEELHKVIQKEILTVDYGGEEKPLQKLVEDFQRELSTEQHIELVKMMHKAGTDENLRKSSNFNEEYMGTPGSFRHISFD